MALLDIVVTGTIVLSAVYLGYCMGKGQAPITLPKKLKASVRTDEQESEIIDRLTRKR